MPDGKIFINYRRRDTAGYARSIYDRFNREHSCRVDVQSGTTPEGGDGTWSYDPGTRVLRLKLGDAETGGEETLRIDTREGKQLFAVSNDHLSEIVLTRQ